MTDITAPLPDDDELDPDVSDTPVPETAGPEPTDDDQEETP